MSSLQRRFGLPIDLTPYICHSVLLIVHLVSFVREINCSGFSYSSNYSVMHTAPAFFWGGGGGGGGAGQVLILYFSHPGTFPPSFCISLILETHHPPPPPPPPTPHSVFHLFRNPSSFCISLILDPSLSLYLTHSRTQTHSFYFTHSETLPHFEFHSFWNHPPSTSLGNRPSFCISLILEPSLILHFMHSRTLLQSVLLSLRCAHATQNIMTAEHLPQHCELHDAVRRDMWPESQPLRDKLYGNLGELRRAAAFVRATGISV